MCRRRILATGLVLSAALWAAPAALALPANLPAYFFGSKLVRAELLVKDGGVAYVRDAYGNTAYVQARTNSRGTHYLQTVADQTPTF